MISLSLCKVQLPEDGGPPIKGLSIKEGYCCDICGKYKSLNEANTRWHMSRQHGLKPARAAEAVQFRKCYLQTFFSVNMFVRLFEIVLLPASKVDDR